MLADDGMLHEAIQSATSQGVVVVASAGNRGNEVPQYPAAYSEVISVTSIDSADVHVGSASYGASVDIAAPGVNIVSAIPHDLNIGDYAVGTGTSMATPWVSGAMALSFQYWSELSPSEVVAKVLNHSDPIDYLNSGYGGKLGHGRVNLYRIMESDEGVYQLPPLKKR
jgi:subtilisin family serine protease